MTRKTTLALVAVLAVAATTAACDGGGRDCGPGTVADGDRCVPACGDGERWDDVSESCESVCADGTSWNGTTGTCEPDLGCGPGTHEDGGECVPDDVECAPGTVWDDEAGACIPVCVAGTHRDDETGACIPDSAACVSGQVWDPEAGDCVDVADFCADGTTWVASEGRCVPDDELIEADQLEGTAENDPAFGGESAYEELALPAVGEAYVIGGTVSAPEDKDGDGMLDPDFDYWIFAVAGPTLIRLAADGVGGASSGFAVVAIAEDLDYSRFGIGSTMDGAVRDVYLPAAGTYAVIATDAMNLIATSGPFFGGEGFGYFITVEQLPTPTATDVTFSDGVASTTATWPAAPPASGSMLGFFSMALDVGDGDAGALFSFELATESGAVSPVMMVFGADHSFLFATDAARPWAVDADETVTVVADYQYFFAVDDTDYGVAIDDLGMGTVDGSLPSTTIDQPEWTYEDGTDFPWTYYGFTATAGDVVTLLATTSTGVTYFEVTSADFATSFGWFQGSDAAPDTDGEIRFYAPYTGLYVVSVLGVQGLEGFLFVERIPEQSFDITLAPLSQTPADATPPETFSGVTVDEREYEAFFLLAPAAGDALWLEVEGAGAFAPVMTLYPIEEPGPLAGTAVSGRAVPVRFPDGAPQLVGVADEAHEAGSFDLTVTPLTIVDLGALTAAAPVADSGRALPAGTTRVFFQMTPDAAGIATITVTPTGFDAALVPRDATLAETGYEDGQSADLPETTTMAVAAGAPALFEVRTASGTPLGAAGSVDVSVTLDPFTPEVEPNDGPSAALAVTSPEFLVGELAVSGDRDWYSVTVAGAAALTAETVAVPGGDPTDTVLRLYDTDGVTELAYDDDGGEGLFSRISYALPAAGTYFVEVGGYADGNTGEYVLFVETRITAFRETFDAEIPSGWTVTDHNGDGDTWTWCDGSSTSGACEENLTESASGGGMAIMNADYALSADDALATPAIDCSALTNVVLELDHYYNDHSPSDEYAVVEVSLDGTTWDEVTRFEGLDVIAHEVFDVTAFAAGHSTVYFRFNYSAGWDFYWMIDDVTVTGS